MKLGVFGGLIAALIIVLLLLAYATLFTVPQTRQALVVRLGQPIRVVTEPGLNYKIPLIDSVIPIDKRILDLESPARRSSPPIRNGSWSMPSRVIASPIR